MTSRTLRRPSNRAVLAGDQPDRLGAGALGRAGPWEDRPGPFTEGPAPLQAGQYALGPNEHDRAAGSGQVTYAEGDTVPDTVAGDQPAAGAGHLTVGLADADERLVGERPAMDDFELGQGKPDR